LRVDLNVLSETAIAELLAANPTAMFRPLLTDGEKVVVGFDAAAFTGLLDGQRVGENA